MTAEKNDIIIVFFSVSAFIALMLLYFLIALFMKERKYRILQLEKLNAEVSAAELERTNISTLFHNDIGPLLSSVKMRLDLIQTTNRSELDACKTVLDQCVLKIRAMANELSAINDFEFSLEDALRQYIEYINPQKMLDIQLLVKDEIQMSQTQNNNLYRILQEIIQNTIKHANASVLKLEVKKENNTVLIRTSDDGIGYNIKKIREHKKLGLGLLGIMTRVELLNGHMSQASDKYPGTKYNITIPLNLYEKR